MPELKPAGGVVESFTTSIRGAWRRCRQDLLAGLVVATIILVGGFSEVAFGGKTFSTAQTLVGVNACRSNVKDCPITRKARDDPRLDPAPQAWQLDPWAHVTSEALHQGTAPLWNPYEAAGAPLAANMSSGALDPLLLAVNLHPTTLTWDVTFLIILVLNGLATFALARVVGLGRSASVAAAVIYGLSGFFFRSGNNSFFRVQLYVPVALLAIEWIFRRKGLLPLAGFGLAVAGCLLVGMPEPAFIILTGTLIYSAVRLFTGPRVDSRALTLGRLGAAGLLGLAIAAPLLLPFAEYVSQAKTFKSGAGTATDPPVGLLNWAAPKIQGPAPWTSTRNWVGAAALVAAAVGVASPSRMRRHCGWPLLAVVLVLTLKMYGAPVISLIGHLPGASQALWPTYGTPTIALPLALLAGIGVESVFTNGIDRRWFATIVAGGLIIVVVLAVTHRDQLRLGFGAMGPGGWGIAALAASIVVVAATAAARNGRAASTIIVVTIVAELLLLTPRGFYSERRDPFPRQTWINELSALARSPGNARIFSTDGLLFPNTSGVYKLADLRVVDAVYVKRYFEYFQTFVAHGTLDRWNAVGPTESYPTIHQNPMFDLMGARYIVEKNPPPPRGATPPDRPLNEVDPNYRIVKSLKGRIIYENLQALPRAFVVHDVHVVPDEAGTLAYLKRGSQRNFDGSVRPAMDPRRQAVIEASKPDLPAGLRTARACPGAGSDAAAVTRYEPSRVELRVHARCAGLLVLSDTYFPGWNATVNGRRREIYPTDVAFRGIAVPAGTSTVVLRYQPASFRNGLVLAGFGTAAFLVAGLVGAARRRRRRIGQPAT